MDQHVAFGVLIAFAGDVESHPHAVVADLWVTLVVCHLPTYTGDSVTKLKKYFECKDIDCMFKGVCTHFG